MRNRRVLVAIVSSSVLSCIGVIACSSDDNKSTFTTTTPDGSFDAGPSIASDADPFQDAPLVCKPTISATFAPTWTPPVPSSACTTSQVDEYYTTCLANDSSGNSQFTKPVCTNWIASAGDCGKCIEKDDLSSPIQVFRDRLYYTLNNAGCIAIEQNDYDPGACGATYDAATQCRRDSCDHCFDQAGTQFSDFTSCQSAADTTGCTEFNQKSTAACVGYKTAGADGGVPQCFPLTDAGTQEDPASFYKRVIGYFCVAK